MENILTQRYLNTDLHGGKINFNKKYIANYIDLIRISPTTSRILFLISSYANRNNTVITDCHTIKKLLGLGDVRIVKSSLLTLVNNGYITIKTIQLNTKTDIIKVTHDRDLYKKSLFKEWKVIDEPIIEEFKVSGAFNLITINDDMITCEEDTEGGSNLILHLKNNLFYDKNIVNDEILFSV